MADTAKDTEKETSNSKMEEEEDLEKLQAEILKMEEEAAKIAAETANLEKEKAEGSSAAGGSGSGANAASAAGGAAGSEGGSALSGKDGAGGDSAATTEQMDKLSVYVGQVEYSATPEELLAHFEPCGAVERVTICCDKFTGQPKGFAYLEFQTDEAVGNALKLDGSTFKGRALKVTKKRVNDRFFHQQGGRGGRGRGRGRGGRGGRRGRGRGGYRGGYNGYHPYY